MMRSRTSWVEYLVTIAFASFVAFDYESSPKTRAGHPRSAQYSANPSRGAPSRTATPPEYATRLRRASALQAEPRASVAKLTT